MTVHASISPGRWLGRRTQLQYGGGVLWHELMSKACLQGSCASSGSASGQGSRRRCSRPTMAAALGSSWDAEDSYDVVVVGAGHAGCEAALASSRLGCSTLLLTLNLDRIAWQVPAALSALKCVTVPARHTLKSLSTTLGSHVCLAECQSLNDATIGGFFVYSALSEPVLISTCAWPAPTAFGALERGSHALATNGTACHTLQRRTSCGKKRVIACSFEKH